VSRLAEKIDGVKSRIAQSCKPGQSVVLVAVSKTRSAEEIREANSAGLVHFGENYLQEALPKIRNLGDLALVWHFIGSIQSNKTRDIAENFDWVQTLDRVKIARRLNDQRPSNLEPLQVCVQINIDKEASKSGVKPEQALELCSQIVELPRLHLRGLMAIPEPSENYENQMHSGLALAALFNEIRKDFPDIDTLSLGMSADLEAAIAAGSTMVRIGSDIFGQRN
jgi:pyridoxal phosphate enzyme (YggS family)